MFNQLILFVGAGLIVVAGWLVFDLAMAIRDIECRHRDFEDPKEGNDEPTRLPRDD